MKSFSSWVRSFVAHLEVARNGGNLLIGDQTQINTPLKCNGRGRVIIGENCSIGYTLAPLFGLGTNTFQARNRHACITIGDACEFSNNINIISLKSISIGSNCLVGDMVLIYDADFHDLNPISRSNMALRNTSDGLTQEVEVEDNVWIGSRCIILKGSHIEKGCVVGAGSIVSGNLPANWLCAGTPAKPIRKL